MAPQSVFITGCNRGWKAGISLLLLIEADLLNLFYQLWQELLALQWATIGQATTFLFLLRIPIVAPNCNYNKQQTTKKTRKSVSARNEEWYAVNKQSKIYFITLFHIISITGIGLELVKQFLALPNPPRNIFATYRSKERSGTEIVLFFSGKKSTTWNCLILALCRRAARARREDLLSSPFAAWSDEHWQLSWHRQPGHSLPQSKDVVCTRKICQTYTFPCLLFGRTWSKPLWWDSFQVDAVVGDAGLNLLINNSGVLPQNRDLHSVTPEDMMEAYMTNCVAPQFLARWDFDKFLSLPACRAFLPLLHKAAALKAGPSLCVDKAAIVQVN